MNRLLSYWFFTRLWILPVGMIWLLLLAIQFDSGHLRFETIDAAYYRELADDFILGKPMVLEGLRNARGNAFSPYPAGYPVLLGICRFLSGGADWPVHLVLHALLALALVLIWQEHVSLLPLALVLFTDSALLLAGTAISEFSFFIFTVLAVFGLSRLEISYHPKWQLLLVLALLASIWTRYAGVFLLPFLVLRWNSALHENKQKARALLMPLLYFVFFMVFLFGSQLADSGLLSGGDRYPNKDSALFLLISLLTGLLNQLLIFRDLTGSSLLSFFAGAIAAGFFFYLIRRAPFQVEGPGPAMHEEKHSQFIYRLGNNLKIAGAFYFGLMVPLRWYFYFAEAYDNRLLAAGFLLFLLGFAVEKEEVLFRQPFWLKMAFLLCASIFFLPLKELIN